MSAFQCLIAVHFWTQSKHSAIYWDQFCDIYFDVECDRMRLTDWLSLSYNTHHPLPCSVLTYTRTIITYVMHAVLRLLLLLSIPISYLTATSTRLHVTYPVCYCCTVTATTRASVSEVTSLHEQTCSLIVGRLSGLLSTCWASDAALCCPRLALTFFFFFWTFFFFVLTTFWALSSARRWTCRRQWRAVCSQASTH